MAVVSFGKGVHLGCKESLLCVCAFNAHVSIVAYVCHMDVWVHQGRLAYIGYPVYQVVHTLLVLYIHVYVYIALVRCRLSGHKDDACVPYDYVCICRGSGGGRQVWS